MGCGYKGWFSSGGGGGVSLPAYDHMWISAGDTGYPSEANFSHAFQIPDNALTFSDYTAFRMVNTSTPDFNFSFLMPQNADNSSAANLKLKIKPVFIAEDSVSGSSEAFITRSRIVDVSQSLQTASWGASENQSIAARSQYDVVMGTSGNPDAAWAINNIANFSSDESALIQIWIERQNTGWSSNLLYIGSYIQYATDWTRVTEWTT